MSNGINFKRECRHTPSVHLESNIAIELSTPTCLYTAQPIQQVPKGAHVQIHNIVSRIQIKQVKMKIGFSVVMSVKENGKPPFIYQPEPN